MHALVKAKLLLFAAIAISSSYACTCFYQGVFLEYAEAHPIVVRGTISGYGEPLRNDETYYESMTVAVNSVVKGTYPHRRIEFQGDTGMSCLRYVTERDYPIGSEHFFIVSDQAVQQPLLVCGEGSVLLTGERIEGRNPPGSAELTYSIALADFLAALK